MALKIRIFSTFVSRFSALHLNQWLHGGTTAQTVQTVQTTDQLETSDSRANDACQGVYGLLVAPPGRY